MAYGDQEEILFRQEIEHVLIGRFSRLVAYCKEWNMAKLTRW
jgi:hypothetical protein